ncbi:CBS domain-containing protein [Paenibacillus sp. GCM10023252]|uniref:CBS domain-containing protein n=1 Tax=Paenibacillus sp. GCM10023252 TaxID=3252649 RepID=UPI003616B5A5
MRDKLVKDLMSKDCVSATLQDNIYELAVLMKQHDIGMVPIVEGKKLIGVTTDRDLVVRGYAEKHSGSTEVAQVMTSDVDTIHSGATADEAAQLMSAKQIRRLPVVDHGELIGMISLGDLAIREVFVDEAGAALSQISQPGENHLSTYH